MLLLLARMPEGFCLPIVISRLETESAPPRSQMSLDPSSPMIPIKENYPSDLWGCQGQPLLPRKGTGAM